jgi:hypothetical protein
MPPFQAVEDALIWWIVPAIVLVGIVVLVSTVMVYVKAGQPGWAAVVPFYNMWVLAEIGDKPGWWGLAAAFAGAIPCVGFIIQVALTIMISIGVANAFDRGTLFGLGLFFMPFIFYPILAFGGEDD